MNVSEQIEAYLLFRAEWVPDIEICARFGVRERQLRATGKTPGLCSKFAISSDKGLKHVRLATRQEWLDFKHRLRRHGIGELIRVSDLEKSRHNVTRTFRSGRFEKDTGQGLLAMEATT